MSFRYFCASIIFVAVGLNAGELFASAPAHKEVPYLLNPSANYRWVYLDSDELGKKTNQTIQSYREYLWPHAEARSSIKFAKQEVSNEYN